VSVAQRVLGWVFAVWDGHPVGQKPLVLEVCLVLVRRIERVRLHADLTILAKLSCALVRARAVSLAA
jgi:uncharacterized membrane protein